MDFSSRPFALIVCAACVSTAFAAVEPLSPVKDETIELLPSVQKKVLGTPTLAERIALTKEREIRKDRAWRQSRPLVLSCRTTCGEKGPWKVSLGKTADLSDARTWYVKKGKMEKPEDCGNGVTQAVVRIELPLANLEIATRYYWKAGCRDTCGFGCHPGHGCEACKRFAETSVASFVTEDLAPRWIAIEGDVHNFRDLGGRIGLDGRRVRQGMIYRGQGLNDNSVTGEVKGRNRLTVEDVGYLTGTLGIRTDLDLRGPGEIADMKESPLGPSVKFVWHSSQCYTGIFRSVGKKAMADNFRVFCDRANYPVYFHCIAGADRTGALAYVLNGVLGVSRRELETDWESTFYPNIPDDNPDPKYWCRESHFNDGFSKYGEADTPWNDRIVLYLKDCGITDAEIETFRRIMLENQ